MSDKHQMRQVKASDDEVQALIDWLQKPAVRALNPPFWERVIYGYQMLVQNACDPALEYLDWKPEIKAKLEPQPESCNHRVDWCKDCWREILHIVSKIDVDVWGCKNAGCWHNLPTVEEMEAVITEYKPEPCETCEGVDETTWFSLKGDPSVYMLSRYANKYIAHGYNKDEDRHFDFYPERCPKCGRKLEA